MAKKNATKQSLMMSIISLLLCFSMLLGTTFAWFTDEVTSGGNVITAGTLKIDLLHLVEGDWVSLKENPDHKVFNYDLWEPGYTQVETLKIANLGNLAFRYQMNVIAEEGTPVLGPNGENLADVIDVYMCFGEANAASFDDIANGTSWWKMGTLAELMASPEGITQGKMLPAGATYEGELLGQNGVMIGECTASIALHMQETAGNEYQGLSVGDLYINLAATQYTHENDSFGNQYDKNATYDDLADTSILATETKTLTEGESSVAFNLVHNGMTIAKVTVPASAIEDPTQPVTVTFDGINPSAAAIVDENTKAYAFDISVTNLKENLADDQLVTVVVTAPNALAAMNAYHNGVLIEDAVYDEVAGTITFKTASFSPYDFTYTEIEVDTLAELRDAVKQSDVEIKLTADLTIDLTAGSADRSEEHKVVGTSQTYYNAVNIVGQNVAINLNGHKITVKCSDTATGNQDVGALFFVDQSGSLNIIDRAGTGFIKMASSIYMVWAPYDSPSYMDIYSGAFIADGYAGDPIGTPVDSNGNFDPANGNMKHENSNRALVYAGTGGNMNIYGGYFLYNNTPNDTLDRNNGAFNCTNWYEGPDPFITIHDGVMLINKEYKQNPANTSTPNGSFDEYSIKLAQYCDVVETRDISVTIDGKTYSKWYRVTSNQPVSLTVSDLQEVYARNDTPSFTVTVNYTYGSKVITNYQMSEVDMSTAGIKNATISYTENDKTVSTEITFKVNAVASIVAVPKQEVYNKGVQLKTTDFTVRAVTNEGMSTNITNFTISNVDTSTTGEKTVTIIYNDNGTEFADTCKITVKNINKVSANSVSLHGWNAGQFIAGSNWVDSYYGYNGKTYSGENGEKATGFNVTGHVGNIELGNPETGYGSLTVTNAKPYTKVGHWGWISFDNYASIEMGYYFDGDVTTYVRGTAIYTGITTDNPDYAIYGPNCHNYQLQADLTSFAPGSNHTVTFVVATEDGILDLCTWKISMATETEDVFIDTDKPNVNVVILAGQSNACGPAPITSAIRNQYEKHDFSNVFIHYRNTGWDGSKYAIVTENVGFDKYQLGIGGWQSYYFGPELGLAYTLSTQATDEQWYIIKYAPTGTCLATEWLSGANLANDMITYVKDAIDILDDTYDVRVRSFLWMQGESDATAPGTASAYTNNEQALVSMVRTELAAYATRSTNAPSVAGSGIAYIDAGIAPNGRADGTNATTGKYVAEGGPNDWIYATYVNLAKYSNCQLWYLPTVTVEGSVFTPGIPVGLYDNNPGHTIKNSIYIDTAALSSKAVATGEHSEYTIESDKSDWAHYNANSMNNLGYWFGASTLYMLNNG